MLMGWFEQIDLKFKPPPPPHSKIASDAYACIKNTQAGIPTFEALAHVIF